MLQYFSNDPAERRKLARSILSRQPRSRRRKVPRQAKPTALELNYYAVIRGVLQKAKALVDRYLMPRLRDLTISSKIDALRADAGPRDVLRIMTLVNGEFRPDVTDTRLEAIANRQSASVTEFGRNQFEKQLKAGTGASVPLQDPPSILRINEAFAAENDAYIKSIPQRYFDEVQKLVLSGISNQTRWEEIAKQVESRYGVAESSAKLIARDQTGKLLGAQTQARQQALGLTKYIWRTVEDERVREEHAERDGEVFEWSEPPEDGHPGQAINCVPGNEAVSLYAPALKAYRYRYSGELAEIVANTGETVRTTPNHPVLTLRGWLPAHLVEVGDHLVETSFERLKLGVENPEGGDTSAEKMFGSLASIGSPMRIADLARGFHGDAIGKNVDVVEIDWRLLFNVFTDRSKRLEQNQLASATQTALGLGHISSNVVALARAANSIVSRLTPSDPLASGGLIHSELLSSSAITWRDAVLGETFPYDGSRNSELLSESFLGDATNIQARDLPTVEVKSVRRSRYDGDVFNFETSTGWFGSHGLVIHNCRCTAEPILDELVD